MIARLLDLLAFGVAGASLLTNTYVGWATLLRWPTEPTPAPRGAHG